MKAFVFFFMWIWAVAFACTEYQVISECTGQSECQWMGYPETPEQSYCIHHIEQTDPECFDYGGAPLPYCEVMMFDGLPHEFLPQKDLCDIDRTGTAEQFSTNCVNTIDGYGNHCMFITVGLYYKKCVDSLSQLYQTYQLEYGSFMTVTRRLHAIH